MKFSVIIPVYNKADTIKESINSVLAQTVEDFEIVVVNDGSTDNIGEVLSEYKDIKVVNQENGGVSVARNSGIDAAEGEFVCFLDADDLWFPNHLETLLFYINENPGINYFITSNSVTHSNGTSYNSSDKLSSISGDFIITDNLFKLLNTYGDAIVNTNCICVKRSSLISHSLRFEPGERLGEDTDMWYRIALKEKLLLSKKITTMYRRENSTATRNTVTPESWIFSRRIYDILSDGDISDSVKKECSLLVDRYTLTCARQLKCFGKSKEAKAKLKIVKYKSGRRYVLTYILCHIPVALCRKILGVKGK